MLRNRLEAFSDGVLAIIITIMVFELKPPASADWTALVKLTPTFLAYVLSFCYLAIYWNNHHHMICTVKQVTAGILWANLHLLFWLSLFPFATAWAGPNYQASWPVAVYGAILLMAGLAYLILQRAIIASQGERSLLADAVGADWKGKAAAAGYLFAIGIAFLAPWISIAMYMGVACAWIVPDRRIERMLAGSE